jgi:signal transduction histidine kinase
MNETILSALENERRYIAKELHDGVAQTTLQLGLQVGICRKLLERGNVEMLAKELATLEGRAQLASAQVREMISDLRPPQVEPEANLDTYLHHAIELHQQRGGPLVTYRAQLQQPLPAFSPAQTLALVRVVQEALLNVRKHAEATTVYLRLSDDPGNFYLMIADNGHGFPAEFKLSSLERNGGLGMLQTRVEAVGGSLTIARDPAEGWTGVRVTIPRPAIKS